ncbi:MAG TPA: Gfo/Idh/MocA family oxidoreductase [Nocardioides sp.]|nr:Gfo/Idh/MocA family oxidoreductase [Nocardioides sp.]
MSTRILMVGAGGVAQRHVQVLTGLPDVDVVGVVDPVEEAARDLARSCGAAVHPSTAEAIDECRPDAVYVCVPPFAHGAPERDVLAHRLPLFVEKPLSARWEVAEDLGRRVAEAGVVTGTGYHWRCLDTVQEARRRLDASPALLASGYWLDKRPPVGWWPHADRSGGQVVEQLTHVLDLARTLLGEAIEVYAAGAVLPAPPPPAGDESRGDVDDATAATVRFVSGAVATLAATSLLRAKHRAALHTFSEGLVMEIGETSLVVDDGVEREVLEPAEDPRTVVDREFVAAVRGERAATRAPYDEALRTHRLACAVAESARRGEPVRLDVGAPR